MQESIGFQHIYCLFCRSGSERQIAWEIETRFPHIRAIAAMQEKHRYIDRHYEIDRRSFLPAISFCIQTRRLMFWPFTGWTRLTRYSVTARKLPSCAAETGSLQNGSGRTRERLASLGYVPQILALKSFQGH